MSDMYSWGASLSCRTNRSYTFLQEIVHPTWRTEYVSFWLSLLFHKWKSHLFLKLLPYHSLSHFSASNVPCNGVNGVIGVAHRWWVVAVEVGERGRARKVSPGVVPSPHSGGKETALPVMAMRQSIREWDGHHKVPLASLHQATGVAEWGRDRTTHHSRCSYSSAAHTPFQVGSQSMRLPD